MGVDSGVAADDVAPSTTATTLALAILPLLLPQPPSRPGYRRAADRANRAFQAGDQYISEANSVAAQNERPESRIATWFNDCIWKQAKAPSPRRVENFRFANRHPGNSIVRRPHNPTTIIPRPNARPESPPAESSNTTQLRGSVCQVVSAAPADKCPDMAFGLAT